MLAATGDDYEHHGGIKCERRSNPGLDITWGPNFFGAVGRISMEGGRITVREELVPYLVHGIRRILDDSDILNTDHAIDLIRSDSGVKVSHGEGKGMIDAMVSNAALIWGIAVRNPKDISAIGRGIAGRFGDSEAVYEIMEKMRDNGIDPAHLTPVGFVPSSSPKRNNSIFVLEESGAYSKDGKHLLYMAQSGGREEATVVKVDAYIARRMIGDILRQFGTAASIMPGATPLPVQDVQRAEKLKGRS